MNLNQSIEIFVQCNFTIDDESTSLSNINDFFSSHQPKNQKCVIYIFEIISTLLQTEPSMDIDLSPIEYSYSMEKDYTDGDFTNSISIHNDRLYLFVHLSKGLCPINFIYNTNIKIKYLIFNYLSEQYSEQFKTDIAENIIDFDCKILHRLFHFLNNHVYPFSFSCLDSFFHHYSVPFISGRFS